MIGQLFIKDKDTWDATSHPHWYLMLDLKPTTHDHHRLKTNVLLKETDNLQQQLDGYMKKQSYRQPPILNAMHVQYGAGNKKYLKRTVYKS